ncbi:hypothetical protein ACTWQL_13775 [Pseudalkalibacillus sp. R45]|uniref:hypothetical protein n=1 Tax=Pseudalkalibacillus sp. R45 TaxID=3457433 RepID=UPI003FCCC0DD
MKSVQKLETQEAKINEKVVSLLSEKEAKVAEIQELKKSYKGMLVDDAVSDAKTSQKSIDVEKTKIEKAEKELSTILERIEALQDAYKKNLSELLPDVKKERDAAVGKAQKEMTAMFRDLRQYKAEYLLAVKKINAVYRKAKEADAKYHESGRKIDPQMKTQFVNLPTLNLFANSDGDDKVIGITQAEVDRAITSGSVPLWVQHFEDTGEVLASDAEVRTRQAEGK